MSEGSLDGDDVATGGDEPGGVEVPEVVQLDAAEAGCGERRPPTVADGVLVGWLVGVPGEEPGAPRAVGGDMRGEQVDQ
jgi:hypothetical protein